MAKPGSDRRRSQAGWIGLIVVLLAAVLAAWLPYHSEQVAIERLEAMGAEVETRPGPHWLEDLWGELVPIYEEVRSIKMPRKATDEDLRIVEGLASLESLSISRAQITDEGLKHLRGLSNLEWLWILDSNITGAGLTGLRDSTKLKRVWLYNTRFNDDGLRNLSGLTSLLYLDLRGTDVSDEGLKHLEGLLFLESLSLDGTRISDRGLKHLPGLVGLRRVYLQNTAVSQGGIEYLRATMPNVATARFSALALLQSLPATDGSGEGQRAAEFEAGEAEMAVEHVRADSEATGAMPEAESLPEDSRSEGPPAHYDPAKADTEAKVVFTQFWNAGLAGNVGEALVLIELPYVGGQLQDSVLIHERDQLENRVGGILSRARASKSTRAIVEEMQPYEEVLRSYGQLLTEDDRKRWDATMNSTDRVLMFRLERADGVKTAEGLLLVSWLEGEARIVGLLSLDPVEW